ncbi:MAG: orotate phosphoribosyltransferase [bacterium]|nr:orotate phosphoribosyltransferase [bacterium]
MNEKNNHNDKEQQKVLDTLKECGGFLEGHFLLSSGLHSGKYLQCALVLQYPKLAEKFGKQLAEKVKELKVDVVIGPALGGVIVAHEVARALGVRALFTERVEGKMTLRRGFTIQPNEHVLAVEDVITTGGSTLEVIRAATEQGGKVVGVAALVDRSGGNFKPDIPVHSLVQIQVETYPPESCPLCKAGIPAVKPGSRK